MVFAPRFTQLAPHELSKFCGAIGVNVIVVPWIGTVAVGNVLAYVELYAGCGTMIVGCVAAKMPCAVAVDANAFFNAVKLNAWLFGSLPSTITCMMVRVLGP